MQGHICRFNFEFKITPGTKPERRERAARSPVGKKLVELPQHEAISHEPSPAVPAEHVLRVVRTGYVLNGRLLRPASVVVSSGKPVGEAAG